MGVTKLETADGSQTKTDEETANELCDFFQSVFVEESNEVLPVFHDRVVKDDCMWDIHFKIEDVEKRLKNLKQDKAPGPDGIHPKILKECAVELARPIYRIFRKSLDEGKLPSDWRTAVVSPIWKKGSRTLASNYRPISLTSVVCKVLEAIIR